MAGYKLRLAGLLGAADRMGLKQNPVGGKSVGNQASKRNARGFANVNEKERLGDRRTPNVSSCLQSMRLRAFAPCMFGELVSASALDADDVAKQIPFAPLNCIIFRAPFLISLSRKM
jgi:hypothetical protein